MVWKSDLENSAGEVEERRRLHLQSKQAIKQLLKTKTGHSQLRDTRESAQRLKNPGQPLKQVEQSAMLCCH